MDPVSRHRLSGKNRPLSVGLVGCGRVATKHMKAIRTLSRDLELVGVVDPDLQAAARLLDGATGSYCVDNLHASSLGQLLARVKPDLLAITTPSGTHTALAQEALQAGCHLLVEKPITLSVAEAQALVDLATRNKRVLAVGHIYRYFPLMEQVRSLLANEELGPVLSGRVTVCWGHDQAYYDAASWRGSWAQDGGVLMNQCVHALDLMLYLLDGQIKEVSAWLDQLRHKLEAEDYGLVHMKLNGGIYGVLEGTTATSPHYQEAFFDIQCQAGSIRLAIRGGRPSIHIQDGRGRSRTAAVLGRFIKETWSRQGLAGFQNLARPHTRLYQDWIRAIDTASRPLADGQAGQAAVEAVLAAYASARAGQAVTLPLEAFDTQAMTGFFDPKG